MQTIPRTRYTQQQLTEMARNLNELVGFFEQSHFLLSGKKDFEYYVQLQQIFSISCTEEYARQSKDFFQYVEQASPDEVKSTLLLLANDARVNLALTIEMGEPLPSELVDDLSETDTSSVSLPPDAFSDYLFNLRVLERDFSESSREIFQLVLKFLQDLPYHSFPEVLQNDIRRLAYTLTVPTETFDMYSYALLTKLWELHNAFLDSDFTVDQVGFCEGDFKREYGLVFQTDRVIKNIFSKLNFCFDNEASEQGFSEEEFNRSLDDLRFRIERSFQSVSELDLYELKKLAQDHKVLYRQVKPSHAGSWRVRTFERLFDAFGKVSALLTSLLKRALFSKHKLSPSDEKLLSRSDRDGYKQARSMIKDCEAVLLAKIDEERMGRGELPISYLEGPFGAIRLLVLTSIKDLSLKLDGCLRESLDLSLLKQVLCDRKQTNKNVFVKKLVEVLMTMREAYPEIASGLNVLIKKLFESVQIRLVGDDASMTIEALQAPISGLGRGSIQVLYDSFESERGFLPRSPIRSYDMQKRRSPS